MITILEFFCYILALAKGILLGEIASCILSNDDDAPAEEVEIQFLKKVEPLTDSSWIKWDWPAKEDKGIVDAQLSFLGPCVPNISDSSRAKSFMQFSLEKDALENFHRICKHGL